ncbi:MAG: septum formation initiator family protein [Thermodesulfovibrionia bacterium]|nr:septum formation initiator family protein [Thermodesulfovibrionia bacterium]
MRQIVMFTFAILVLICLTLSLIFSEKGILRYRKLQSDKGQIMAENSRIEKQNNEIRQQVEVLKRNPENVEEIARGQGLTKEGELIFKFNEDH